MGQDSASVRRADAGPTKGSVIRDIIKRRVADALSQDSPRSSERERKRSDSRKHSRKTSKSRDHRSSRHEHSPPSGNANWSRKSYLQGNEHQQQQLPSPKARLPEATDEEASRDRQDRCERLRIAKNDYLPAEARQEKHRSWDEQELYDHVDRAVREATRHSEKLAGRS